MSVVDHLAAAGDVPAGSSTRAKQKKSILQFELTKKKVPRRDLMHFSRQLAVFIKAGIPILDALEAIHEEMGNKYSREVVKDMMEQLRAGSTFAGAAAAHGDAFPPYFVGILRSAELTGRLDTVLIQLSEYIERDVEARRKITSALVYPAIISVLAIGVVIVLVSYVLPRFETFFDQLDAELPLPTRMLLGTSAFLTDYWYLFAGLGVLLVLLGLWLTQNARGRRVRDRLLLRIPALGELLRHALLERFCRILSSMMSAGVPMPEALATTAEATNNVVYKEGITQARDAMMRGEGLAEPLSATGLFPPAAKQMFRVGEDTGTLDEQLETAAIYFDRELDYKIKNFTSLFEPLVLVAMGGVVGFVAIALVSAMYGVFNQTSI